MKKSTKNQKMESRKQLKNSAENPVDSDAVLLVKSHDAPRPSSFTAYKYTPYFQTRKGVNISPMPGLP